MLALNYSIESGPKARHRSSDFDLPRLIFMRGSLFSMLSILDCICDGRCDIIELLCWIFDIDFKSEFGTVAG